MPGRYPLVQVLPPSVEVANPISAPPPLKIRATWNALTIVEPFENVLGSTSVSCWLGVSVKVSSLSCVRLTWAWPKAVNTIPAAKTTRHSVRLRKKERAEALILSHLGEHLVRIRCRRSLVDRAKKPGVRV